MENEDAEEKAVVVSMADDSSCSVLVGSISATVLEETIEVEKTGAVEVNSICKLDAISEEEMDGVSDSSSD